jgi:predicted MFS family arabinose efflux permease
MLALVCVLTFLHHAGAQMRAPVLPLYAAAHGATPTTVGVIIGAHMAVAAIFSLPMGRASDRWDRGPLLLGGMAVSTVTSLVLPYAEGEISLTIIYGLAGLGIAAFTPSALSLVADTVAVGRAGQGYAWYSTAHYGAIAMGPFLGGLAAQWAGYRPAFLASAVVTGIAMIVGLAVPARPPAHAGTRSSARVTDVIGNPAVWAGWIASVGGLLIQGAVFTFFPLLASRHGLTPSAIGFVFLVLGLANTVARFPAGWLVDRSGRPAPYAIAGLLIASAATALLPHVDSGMPLLVLAALCGGVSGLAFVAISTALAAAATPATRGLVMGGYSTCLYLGLALGSFALGPVISHQGYLVGFLAAGAAGALGTGVAAVLWRAGLHQGLNGGARASAEGSRADSSPRGPR